MSAAGHNSLVTTVAGNHLAVRRTQRAVEQLDKPGRKCKTNVGHSSGGVYANYNWNISRPSLFVTRHLTVFGEFWPNECSPHNVILLPSNDGCFQTKTNPQKVLTRRLSWLDDELEQFARHMLWWVASSLATTKTKDIVGIWPKGQVSTLPTDK